MTKTEKSNKTSKKSNFATKLSWLPKKTFELEFTIPWVQAKKTYDEVLEKVAKETAVKGFRKGTAPLNLVEKNLDKQKLYQEVIKTLLPETYEAAVKKHGLRPIILPKIKVIALQEGKDWQFKATSCETPEVKLGDYQTLIKGELNKTKIWFPGKQGVGDTKEPNKGKPGKEEQSYDQKLRIVTKTLLENIKVEIPEVLVEDEVNRMLSRLLDQVNTLGMTIEQYLTSQGKTSEQLRQNYHQQAQQTLKLEFILQNIVADRKIKVEEKEIDKLIQATPDEKLRQKLNDPLERNYLASILAKRKVLDYLTSL